jgi:hypothetical protein
MARRFTTLPGIGRCTIVLEGVDDNRRQRARLVFQVETGRVYLVTSPGAASKPMPVTTCPTFDLLDHLGMFSWWLPLGPVGDDSDDEG